MTGELKTNVFLVKVVEEVERLKGNLMHACNTTGLILASNATFFNSSFVSFWPAGDYKVSVNFFDNVDDNIYMLAFHMSVVR